MRNRKAELFYGTEAEGGDQGVKTLFVTGTSEVDFSVILQHLNIFGISRIYFGAGDIRGISKKHNHKGFLHRLVSSCKRGVIVEIDSLEQIKEIPEDLLSFIQFVFVVEVEDSSLGKYVSSFKFLDRKQVVWIDRDKKAMFKTLLSDNRYEGDRPLL